MARKPRGGKAGPRAKTERDRQDIRRLLRAAGSREELARWISQEPVLEDFDDRILPGLAFMEEWVWRHQRSPKARRAFKQHVLELRQREKDPTKRIGGRINYPFTREQIIRWHVDAVWPDRKELGLGNSKEAAVHRLIRKLRKVRV